METMGDESAVNVVEATNEGGDGDAGENPSLADMGMSSGPTSLNLAVGPPSPLTGCYLLIVIGEPYSLDHKDIIVQKLLKGKLTLIKSPSLHNYEYQLMLTSEFFITTAG
jgi:hypothetical protein